MKTTRRYSLDRYPQPFRSADHCVTTHFQNVVWFCGGLSLSESGPLAVRLDRLRTCLCGAPFLGWTPFFERRCANLGDQCDDSKLSRCGRKRRMYIAGTPISKGVRCQVSSASRRSGFESPPGTGYGSDSRQRHRLTAGAPFSKNRRLVPIEASGLNTELGSRTMVWRLHSSVCRVAHEARVLDTVQQHFGDAKHVWKLLLLDAARSAAVGARRFIREAEHDVTKAARLANAVVSSPYTVSTVTMMASTR